jgi:putative oxidoreductase
MKIITLIARLLLGLVFLVFGLNGILNFLPQGPMPAGQAGLFIGALMASHYVVVVSVFEIAAAVLFLLNRYVPLAVVLIAPIIVNILIFHLLMAPASILPGLVVTLCWLVVAGSVRSAFAGIFQKRA